MRHITLPLFVLCSFIGVGYAQSSEVIGKWQLSKVLHGDKTYATLKVIYIIEESGMPIAARSAQSESNWN